MAAGPSIRQGTTREHMLASYLPYVTGVGEDVLMLRDGDVMASFAVAGIEADTADETLIADVARAMAATVAQARPEIAFYVHRVSHETAPTMPPVPGDGFAARIDRQWQGAIAGGGLRERVSMVSVVVRPQRLHGLWSKITGGSKRDLRAERGRRVALLNEVTEDLMQAVAPTRPERLTLSDGRWLGLLRTAVTGKYAALTPGAAFTPVANLLVDSRVDFHGDTFVVMGADSEDMRFGAMFCFKKYPTETAPGFLDRLDLPGDTVVTHSFTPMDLVPALARVQRTVRQMSAADDAARSAQADLVNAADDLASGRISFGTHQVSVMAIARTEDELDALAVEIRTQAQRALAVAVREDLGARAAYFAQHPGNFAFRSRAAMISSSCFADCAALHTSGRGLLPGTEPWGAPITILPTATGEPYRFSFHLGGKPGDRTVGHTLVIGKTGSGKTLGTAFLAGAGAARPAADHRLRQGPRARDRLARARRQLFGRADGRGYRLQPVSLRGRHARRRLADGLARRASRAGRGGLVADPDGSPVAGGQGECRIRPLPADDGEFSQPARLGGR